MNIRQTGRVSTTVLACALAAAALPAQAARRTAAPAVHTQSVLIPADDAYSLGVNDTLAIVAPGVMANDVSGGSANLTVSLLAGPSHGSLTLAADGGFAYTPAPGFSGTDAFRYGIGDGGLAMNGATVTLFVVATTDLALSANVSTPIVETGSPVTFTFTVLNEGAAGVDGVEVEVTIPTIDAGPAGFTSTLLPDAGCITRGPGSWLCSMGPVASSATVQAAFTLVPVQAQTIEASATLISAQSDPSDNSARVTALVGRVWANPGQVRGRTPWAETGIAHDVVTDVALENDSPAALKFGVELSDRTAAKTVVPGWLSVTPASGGVDAFSSQPLSVRMSAAGLTPGLKRGLVHFTHDSPFTLQDVPVSFTVAFLDVNADDSGNANVDASIHALAGANVTAGCRNGYFCPDETLAPGGATVWLLLAREGYTYTPAAPDGLFQDVPLDGPQAPFIEELVRRGVAEGCDADRFCPDQPLARADMAVMVIRMLEGVRFKPLAGQPMFLDMLDEPRAPWVDEAVRRGLFAACTEGPQSFCPDAAITRADAAVSVVKAFDLPLY